MPPKKPNITYSAPVGSIDLPADDYEIWPCTDCLPWHAEVVEHEDGTTWVREWHAVDCPLFIDLLNSQES